MDEHRLIGGVIAGDSDATESFVHEYERRIRRVIRDAGVPAADIPDLAQEILFEALKQLSRGAFEQRAALQTWVRRIAQGKIVDYWRANRRRRVNLASSLEATDSIDERFCTPAAQETRLLVAEALAAMPVRHRLALAAHCRGEVPIEDVAKLLGLSVKRTRNIITEAKALFRSHVCGSGNAGLRRRLSK